ncbi:MAG: P-loop NTPase [archaeon]|nr:MAG: P-loop NTPase [archaeon]
MDPRTCVIKKRIEGIKRIIAVAGGKGGIGKSLVSSVMALNLSNMGYRVGLLDLDFSGPSAHLILGTGRSTQPREEKGVIPPTVCGIKFFSLVFYSGKKPSPLRGIDISNIIKEILCITRWGELDVLVIDMPPGMGDAILDPISLMDAEFLVVTTPSLVSVGTVSKFLSFLEESGTPSLGVLENMRIKETSRNFFGADFLGSIKLDLDLEKALGKPEKLMQTKFSSELREIMEKVF